MKDSAPAGGEYPVSGHPGQDLLCQGLTGWPGGDRINFHPHPASESRTPFLYPARPDPGDRGAGDVAYPPGDTRQQGTFFYFSGGVPLLPVYAP